MLVSLPENRFASDSLNSTSPRTLLLPISSLHSNFVLIMQSSSGELASFYACISACRSKVRDKIVLARSREVENTKKLLVENKSISTCTKLNNVNK